MDDKQRSEIETEIDEYLMTAIRTRLQDEKFQERYRMPYPIRVEDLSHALQDEFKKLVASIAEEKPGAVNDILLVGNFSHKETEIFFAVTNATLEIVSHSELAADSKGNEDLIFRLGKVNIPTQNIYGADPRQYRHWVIRHIEAFPISKGVNDLGFADIRKVARLVATTSPNAQTPLPRRIHELFKIKVDFGIPAELQADPLPQEGNVLFKKDVWRTGDDELCAAFGVKSINTVRSKLKKTKEYLETEGDLEKAKSFVFDYVPYTKEKRLSVFVINETLTINDRIGRKKKKK